MFENSPILNKGIQTEWSQGLINNPLNRRNTLIFFFK